MRYVSDAVGQSSTALRAAAREGDVVCRLGGDEFVVLALDLTVDHAEERDAARVVEASIVATGAHVYAARRDVPHTRDLVLVTPDAQRTIFVVGAPLHPRRDDPLPWDVLASCDQEGGIPFDSNPFEPY